MGTLTLSDLSKKMADIDYAMLLTRAESGDIAGRPMSNNGQVEYRGDSYFFSMEDTHTVEDIGRDPKVALSFAGRGGIVGQRPVFISVEGQAEIVRDKGAFLEHWSPDLDRWFEKGADTPGLVMIRVHASRIHYWDGEDEGEIMV